MWPCSQSLHGKSCRRSVMVSHSVWPASVHEGGSGSTRGKEERDYLTFGSHCHIWCHIHIVPQACMRAAAVAREGKKKLPNIFCLTATASKAFRNSQGGTSAVKTGPPCILQNHTNLVISRIRFSWMDLWGPTQ
ncbi:Nucleolar complex protein 4 [Zea mays]|uniref:Nucleolar complex protein 4 n=1 Tax=Zea mays TaxID=4577 RepID=A0A1D6JBS0_MAIZE|nr:Nucleolar complex protein 4 [Zea mays]